MRDLSDLIKETLNFDPHFSTVVGKRFRALASVPVKVVAATGDGVDPERANLYASQLRSQLARIPQFRQNVVRLDWAHCNGRAALEKVWTPAELGSGYQWRIRELNWIHARRLSFGPERELRVRDDEWSGQGFEARGFDLRIPHKFITFQPQLFDEDPEREGFGPRGLYWSFFKRFSWRERMILTEVFGKPWKVIELALGTNWDPTILDDAQARADELGANSSAAMPSGAKLHIANPDSRSTEPHRFTSQDCDDQISKLVLGVTRTTDAQSDGLGGQQALVHQDGESLVISADGWSVSEALTHGISYDFVELNHGPGELVNAPEVQLNYELPPDQTVELERTDKALSLGVPIKVDEIYERSGFSKPEVGDAVVTRESSSAVPGTPSARASMLEPDTEESEGDPLVPLARAIARGLRLSRLSSTAFSRPS
jgi:phage gp29-like protein